MRCLIVVASAILAPIVSGCGYHGAVYSSYQQLGLDIRATTESNAPVKVSLSYERGAGALVPKLDMEKSRGDAVSLLSTDDVATTAGNPKATKDWLGNPPLRASSAFISGPAAVVASAPSNTVVTIVEPRGNERQIQTTGSAGARIAAALRPSARFAEPVQQEFQQEFDQLRQQLPATQKQTFDRAATMLGTKFEQKYRSVAAHGDAGVGFIAAKNEMLAANPGKDDDVARLALQALRTAAH